MFDQLDVLSSHIIGYPDSNSIEAEFFGEAGAGQKQRERAAADVKHPSVTPVDANQLLRLSGPLTSQETSRRPCPRVTFVVIAAVPF